MHAHKTTQRSRLLTGTFLFAFLVLATTAPAAADDWPQFRGPDGQGHSTVAKRSADLERNREHRLESPHCRPGLVVARDRGQSDLAHHRRRRRPLAAGHRASIATRARPLYDVEVFHLDEPGPIHANNSHASPTPVIDGDRVYVHFGAHGTACLSTDGAVDLENAGAEVQPRARPRRLAGGLERSADRQLRRHRRAVRRGARQGTPARSAGSATASTPAKSAAAGKQEVPMAYCTPLVIEIDGRTQLVSLGSDAVVAHDPATGDELWWFTFNGYSNVAKPVYAKGMLFFPSGLRHARCSTRSKPAAGATSPRRPTAVEHDQGGVVPLDVSPLVVGDELYTISDSGIAVCYDAASGKQHWQKRLERQILGLARVMPTAAFIASTKRPPPPCWRRQEIREAGHQQARRSRAGLARHRRRRDFPAHRHASVSHREAISRRVARGRLLRPEVMSCAAPHSWETGRGDGGLTLWLGCACGRRPWLHFVGALVGYCCSSLPQARPRRHAGDDPRRAAR